MDHGYWIMEAVMDHETGQGDMSPSIQAGKGKVELRWDEAARMAREVLLAQEEARALASRDWSEAEVDHQPPWSEWRLRPTAIEACVTGKTITWVRGRDIPRDTPLKALRTRLQNAMRKRGGMAQVWETPDGIHLILSPWDAQGRPWKGATSERLYPLP